MAVQIMLRHKRESFYFLFHGYSSFFDFSPFFDGACPLKKQERFCYNEKVK
jgi:hypothetical protein